MPAGGQWWLIVTIHVDHLNAQLQHPSVPLHPESQLLPEARRAQHPQRDCEHPSENSPVFCTVLERTCRPGIPTAIAV